MKSPFYNKKIGIWGFGVVGQSAYQFFKQHTNSIEILSEKSIEQDVTPAHVTIQTKDATENFFAQNDFILSSPGIPLHDFQQYKDKIVTELDIFTTHTNIPTIAITGTLGKTTTTEILSTTISCIMRGAIAAGNIGLPMLNLINQPCDIAVLELSSFQLQEIKQFAPDLAIWSNFYDNHLDHHKSSQEYFEAKCNIIKYQTKNQQALLPLNLFEKISKIIPPQKNWKLFSSTKPDTNLPYDIYFHDNNKIFLLKNNEIQEIYNFENLPKLTLTENMLIIIAALHMQSIPPETIQAALTHLKLPHHRLELIATINQSQFFNDSKATVWQATFEAIQQMDNRPIKLFLGGLSKGADRTPFLEKIQNKNIHVFAFGKEADQIHKLCNKFNIKSTKTESLDDAFQACTETIQQPSNILFSPGGSSFDLFKNYQVRGDYFVKLVKKYENVLKHSNAN